MIKNKRVLITGVCGFLGHNLTKKLLENNNEIFGIDKVGNSTRIPDDLLDGINYFEGDLAQQKTFDELPNNLDYVFHFGSPASVILFNKDPFGCYTTTIDSMINVLEYAKKNSVDKMIYPSTASVYAGNDSPHNETILVKPRNMYGAAKLACEGLASAYHNHIKSIGLRIFAAYGPGEEKKSDFASVISIFLNDFKNKQVPVIYGDGTQTRDFIFVDDTIDAIINSADTNYTGIINVGSGRSTSFNEIITIINSILDQNITPQYIEKKLNYVENLQADTMLMQNVLRVNPRSLENGIKEFSRYLKII